MKINGDIKQFILVRGNSLILYNKKDNKWVSGIETDCEYGKNGYSNDKKEGDFTTPLGTYPLLFAFGTEENPGTKMEYRKITRYSYFSDDASNMEKYNKWIESKVKIKGEHLIEYKKEYKYGIVIGYNIDPVISGKGSSIFLHCKGNKGYTAGCIAVDEDIMFQLLQKINKDAYIVIKGI